MDAAESAVRIACELLCKDNAGSLFLNCTVCTGQAAFIEGDLAVFLSVWHNKQCNCGKGFLSILTTSKHA